MQLRYRPDTPLVLKGISLSIKGGEKVGVVGRTGSGKSTLIQALFRLVEPSDGRIMVDNLDIRNIGVKDLRSKFGIIPQEPTLFEGTVRSNIDPLEEHTDPEIWEVSWAHIKHTQCHDPAYIDILAAVHSLNFEILHIWEIYVL